MSDEELERLLADLESDRVERKASFADKGPVCEAVCAFANDLPGHGMPGVVFIGVHDDATCAGLAITDELLRNLGGLRNDFQIVPVPSITVQKRSLRGCELAVVLVEPADAPPVRYRGRIWVRVGPRRGLVTADDERRLNEKRRARDLPFDLRPFPSARQDELDLLLFQQTYLPAAVAPDVLERNDRTVLEQLVSTKFVSSIDEPVPTTVGLLVCGKDPLRYLPGAYVQFLRIQGEQLADPIADREEISGPLPQLIARLDDKLKAHVRQRTDPRPTPETRSFDYPLEAIRQLAWNAILHRSYESTHAPVRVYWFDNRLEMYSPGGPFGQVNRSNFGQPGITDYRNPHLAEAMKNLGYVQRFGVGIAMARRALAENGNPPPEFAVEDSYVLATIRVKP